MQTITAIWPLIEFVGAGMLICLAFYIGGTILSNFINKTHE
jgi:hypothetical protein